MLKLKIFETLLKILCKVIVWRTTYLEFYREVLGKETSACTNPRLFQKDLNISVENKYPGHQEKIPKNHNEIVKNKATQSMKTYIYLVN